VVKGAISARLRITGFVYFAKFKSLLTNPLLRKVIPGACGGLPEGLYNTHYQSERGVGFVP
jgi:hypothetical protein